MQLDLLSWSKPADIIPFPASKRVGKIRHVASLIHRREGKDRETYWSRITDDMIRQMMKAQVPPVLIGIELCDFENAVFAEVRRLELVDRHKGGAA
jgi:hypothetical protein